MSESIAPGTATPLYPSSKYYHKKARDNFTCEKQHEIVVGPATEVQGTSRWDPVAPLLPRAIMPCSRETILGLPSLFWKTFDGILAIHPSLWISFFRLGWKNDPQLFRCNILSIEAIPMRAIIIVGLDGVYLQY